MRDYLSIALLLVICLIVFVPLPTAALVNIENQRQATTITGIHLRTGIGWDFRSANGRYHRLHTNLRIDNVRDRHHSFGVFEYSKGTSAGTTFMKNGMAHLRRVRSLFSGLFGEIFAQHSFDDFSLLKGRTLIGTSLRKQLVSGTEDGRTFRALRIYAGLGTMLEHEQLVQSENPVSDNLRSTNYLSASWVLHQHADLSAVAYYQPLFDDFSDYRLLVQGSIRLTLTNFLSMKTDLNHYFDSEPPNTVDKHNLQLNQKLELKF